MKKVQSSVFFKTMRKQAGLTQEEVAHHLGYSSKQIVSNWERGLCTPPLASLAKLAKLLKIKKSDIVDVFLFETQLLIEKQFSSKPSSQSKSS